MQTRILGDGGVSQNLNMRQMPRAVDQVCSHFIRIIIRLKYIC